MKKIYTAILAAAALIMSACEKNEEESTLTSTGEMELKIDHKWGDASQSFLLNQYFVNPQNSDSVNFTKLNYYISNVKLKLMDGSYWKAENSYHLIQLEEQSLIKITLQNIPKNDYVGIAFTLGVDSTRNVSGAQTGALDPANEMFWSWNTGYIFVKAEGKSPEAPAENNQRFAYHLGGFSGDKNAIQNLQFEFNQNLSVQPQAKPSVHLHLEVSSLWGSDFSTANDFKIHMPGAKAVDFTSNFANGFTLDHVHR